MAHLKGKKHGGDFGQGQKGPLRKIVYVIRISESIFEKQKVHLECGHDVLCSGGAVHRARCWKCKRESLGLPLC
jgi:hypothetical protein